jgi:type IV pilus assembly protein PilM
MLGIDISDNSIKVVELAEGGTPRLQALCWSPLPRGLVQDGKVIDGHSLAQVIQETLTQCLPGSVHDRRAVAAVPERHTFIQVIEVPQMSDAETNEAIPWAAREHLPIDLDRVYVDWQPLPDVAAEPSKRPVLVGAAKRNVVESLIRVLDEIGVQTIALEPGPLAVARSVLPAGSGNVQDIVILDLGASETDIVFFDRGSMRLTASVQRGGKQLNQTLMTELQLPLEEAERQISQLGVSANNGAQVASVLRDAVSDLMSEVRKVVGGMVSQTPYLREPKAILLTGGSANIPGIVEVVTTEFPGVSVQLAKPWTNIMIDRHFKGIGLTKEDAMHFTTAIGLALRQVDRLNQSPGHEVNLLPTERYRRLAREAIAEAGLATLQSNLAGVAIAVAVGMIAWGTLAFLSSSLSASSEQIFLEKVNTHQELQATIQKRNDVLQSTSQLGSRRHVWSDQMTEILQALTPGTVLTRVDANSAEGKFVLTGTAASRTALASIEQRLRSLSMVADVISLPSNFLSDQPSFRIDVVLKES